MASMPGETPKFNIELETSRYDHERIADEVLWPLIDHLSETPSWREDGDAEPVGYSTMLTKEGKLHELGVGAASYIIEMDDDYDIPSWQVDEVSIDVLEIVENGPLHDMVFERAFGDGAEIQDAKDAVVKTGVRYCFNTDGEVFAIPALFVEDRSRNALWSVEDGVLNDTELESQSEGILCGIMTETYVGEVVMADISTVLEAFAAPEELRTALEHIKSRPM